MLRNNPITLDPAFLTDIYGRAVVSQIFDGLVQFDAHLKPIPALADFWEASRDGRTWTFTLRRGVMFHHGREVTAQDVVYSFTRLLILPKAPACGRALPDISRGPRSSCEGKLHSVEGLKAVDRYTLQMVLEEPLGPFFGSPGAGQCSQWSRRKRWKSRESALDALRWALDRSNLSRWEPNQEIVLEANDHYYEGRPFLDAVVFKIVVGDKFEETFAEFLQGNLEETIIPSGKTDEVRADPQYRQYQRFRKPTLSLLYIGFNTQFKPFDDRRVRQAFNYAVNKEAIVREITRMGSLPATGALPPGMLGYDPDSARGTPIIPPRPRLLAEAGYPDGTGFPVVQLWSVHQG